MRKFVSIVLMVMLMSVSLFGCSGKSKPFSGEWTFSQVSSVEFVQDVSESDLEYLKELYNTEDEEVILSSALDRFIADETFADFYLKFDVNRTYTYDPFADREATWVFYQTSETEGFISFYTELDVNDGNPDPVVCPEIVYEADTDTMYIVLHDYGSFMVTIELTR